MGLVTQQDPIGIAGGLNLYGYGNGDPINFSDPFGLCPVPMACLFGALAGMAVETGAQAISVARGGEWNGGAIGAAGILGAASGGLATAARLGRAAKGVAMVAFGATEAAGRSDAETPAALAADIGAGAFVGLIGHGAGQLAEQTAASRPVASWIRSRLATGASQNSITSRVDMARRLQELDEGAILGGMVAGGVVTRAGGG